MLGVRPIGKGEPNHGMIKRFSISLALALCLLPLCGRTEEAQRLDFKPELFEVLRDEWSCGLVCEDLLTTKCFYPDYRTDQSLLPEEAPFLQWHLNQAGRHLEELLKDGILPPYHPVNLEDSPGCCDKRCVYLPLGEYTIYAAESQSVISLVAVSTDGSPLEVDEEFINEFAKWIFTSGQNIDLVTLGDFGPVSYGTQRGERPASGETMMGDLLKRQEVDILTVGTHWYDTIFWWADGEKLGFFILYPAMDPTLGTAAGRLDTANSDWFEKLREMYLKNPDNKLPAKFTPPKPRPYPAIDNSPPPRRRSRKGAETNPGGPGFMELLKSLNPEEGLSADTREIAIAVKEPAPGEEVEESVISVESGSTSKTWIYLLVALAFVLGAGVTTLILRRQHN